ncbi:Flagellar biosynthesis protein FlhB [Desulfurella amilsii]|uniref:Flagellar biosynthetic protein FlhB n=1 Tax=Desulfurella amilsii TaxID=1562698 RepID=A0A1X4XYH7_9BACT|nr:flagellar biosynthesis protein FlhB [Desulfurella amilsii]OSS42589.1 Flagellar biosynthesis protein FlhB [Desulfurella amilsii]
MAGEKTEKATPKRREESRKKGQVAKSIELNSAVLLFVALIFFYFNANNFKDTASYSFNYFLNLPYHISLNNVGSLYADIMKIFFMFVGVFFVLIVIVALLVNVAQTGIMLSFEKLNFDLEKLNPINGIKNLFSLRALGELAKSILKIIIIFSIMYLFIKVKYKSWLDLTDQPINVFTVVLAKNMFAITFYLVLFMVFLAILDYIYQKYIFEHSIMMSKEEVKEEFKQMEGDPKIKAKIRKMQMELARRRMMENVKTADVVITNPTHIAVALKYDQSKMNAPKVVAKGLDEVALRIKEIAIKNNVVIVENPPVAQSLYKQAQIDKEIPIELYETVAKILSYVYNLKNKKTNKLL